MKLTAIFKPQSVSVSVSAESMGVTICDPVAKEYVDVPEYTGAYEVTPSADTQTLDTTGLRMTRPVVVYGLVVWDGGSY